MNRSLLSKIPAVVALAIFAGLTAYADPIQCSTITTLAQAEAANGAGGGCQIGNLLFNNFSAQFTPTGGATAPTPGDVTLTFVQMTASNGNVDPSTGVAVDPYGTAASDVNPLIALITDYSAADDFVTLGQSLQFQMQYTVSLVSPNTSVIEVDSNAAGGTDQDNVGTAALNLNTVCNGAAFGAISGSGPSSCSGTPAEVVDNLDGGSMIYGGDPSNYVNSTANPNPPSYQDSYGNQCNQLSGPPVCNQTGGNTDQNNNAFNGTPGSGSAAFGVYSEVTMQGGNVPGTTGSVVGDGSGNSDYDGSYAYVNQTEQDFLEETPEPGTFVLMGGVLAALGLIRRKKAA